MLGSMAGLLPPPPSPPPFTQLGSGRGADPSCPQRVEFHRRLGPAPRRGHLTPVVGLRPGPAVRVDLRGAAVGGGGFSLLSDCLFAMLNHVKFSVFDKSAGGPIMDAENHPTLKTCFKHSFPLVKGNLLHFVK